jgi:hypothetical protein
MSEHFYPHLFRQQKDPLCGRQTTAFPLQAGASSLLIYKTRLCRIPCATRLPLLAYTRNNVRAQADVVGHLPDKAVRRMTPQRRTSGTYFMIRETLVCFVAQYSSGEELNKDFRQHDIKNAHRRTRHSRRLNDKH